MEPWVKKPKPTKHTIINIKFDTVWCSCSWNYQCKEADKMPKGVLENELLDTHKSHIVQMAERGL